jgi:RNA polymerase sigma-70 factor (sigma-E family)
MKATAEQAFREFAAARIPALTRTAYLLCGDWHLAEDVVSTAIVKLYRSWRRVGRMDHPEAYARQVIVRTWLDETRRPWRRERPTANVPDRPSSDGEVTSDAIARRAYLRRLLTEMPARQRAVLVLRFYDDMSVERTAEILGCSPGAVKALTSRALGTIRGLLPDGVATVTDLEEAL